MPLQVGIVLYGSTAARCCSRLLRPLVAAIADSSTLASPGPSRLGLAQELGAMKNWPTKHTRRQFRTSTLHRSLGSACGDRAEAAAHREIGELLWIVLTFFKKSALRSCWRSCGNFFELR
jgi:hypothetical protein